MEPLSRSLPRLRELPRVGADEGQIGPIIRERAVLRRLKAYGPAEARERRPLPQVLPRIPPGISLARTRRIPAGLSGGGGGGRGGGGGGRRLALAGVLARAQGALLQARHRVQVHLVLGQRGGDRLQGLVPDIQVRLSRFPAELVRIAARDLDNFHFGDRHRLRRLLLPKPAAAAALGRAGDSGGRLHRYREPPAVLLVGRGGLRRLGVGGVP